jgi:hypothetical protein
MAKATSIQWLKEPEPQDYPAALSYLTLVCEPKVASRYVKKLRAAAVEEYKAKDIFRASELSLLGVSNSHVERDRQKIRARKSLSPLLLVRQQAIGRVIVADGYHRLCAVYSFNEDAVVPCKIV